MADIINVSSLRIVRINIGASYDDNGHGGWGVVVYSQKPASYKGHILTSHLKTAAKMSLAMALIVAPVNHVTNIYTDSMANMNAFNRPDMNDVMDEEIARIREYKPLTSIIFTVGKALRDAHMMAHCGMRGR